MPPTELPEGPTPYVYQRVHHKTQPHQRARHMSQARLAGRLLGGQLLQHLAHARQEHSRALEDARYRRLLRAPPPPPPPHGDPDPDPKPNGRHHHHHHHHHHHNNKPSHSPPCLRCALAGLRCSATYVRYQDEVRCRRCRGAGEEFCLRQRQDITRPRGGLVMDPAWLRGVNHGSEDGDGDGKQKEGSSRRYRDRPAVRGGSGGGDMPVWGGRRRSGKNGEGEREEEEEEGGEKGKEEEELFERASEEGALVNPFGMVAGGRGEEVWEAGCMVYCLDPVLQGDKRRLLDIAADMLHYDGAKVVHGTRVSPIHVRNFALPMWHENDRPGNKEDPDYLTRLPEAYFRELTARREERRVGTEMRLEKTRTVEMWTTDEQRIDEEKARERMLYRQRDAQNGCDMEKKMDERRRIFGAQMALKKPVIEIKKYMNGLTNNYIEEIKAGLRTELPF